MDLLQQTGNEAYLKQRFAPTSTRDETCALRPSGRIAARISGLLAASSAQKLADVGEHYTCTALMLIVRSATICLIFRSCQSRLFLATMNLPHPQPGSPEL
jgi:hypothetical protein